MKKMTVVVGLICLLVFSGTALAADTAGKFGVGVELGYNKIADASVPNQVATDAEFDGSFLFGGTGSYFFTDYFSMEMTLDYTKTDVDEIQSGVSTAMGEMTQIPWLLTGRFHYPNASIVSPYIGGGVGYYFNNFDESNAWLIKTKTNVDPENNFGFHLNGGVEVFATDNVAIDCDLKYTWTSADFEVSKAGKVLSKDSIDLDTFTGTVGLKFYF